MRSVYLEKNHNPQYHSASSPGALIVALISDSGTLLSTYPVSNVKELFHHGYHHMNQGLVLHLFWS